MEGVQIRLARQEESELISDLALRSKAHWGYSAEFLDACRAELTYDASECGSGRMWVAVAEKGLSADAVLGFSLLGGSPPSGELSAFFVDPTAIGTGCGRRLLSHILGQARAQGFERLGLDADPGAEAFYLHFGAVRIGTSMSGSIPGRTLPHLEFAL